MQRYKMTLSYDGTQYGGWQVQPNTLSIQSLVEKALSIALRTPTKAYGSGRTDAGVHALGQTAHFTVSNSVDTLRLLGSLNGLLPQDIRVKSLEEVPLSFHARYSAKGKIYHYHLHLEQVEDPFKRLYTTLIRYPLDRALLKQACQLLIGTHDFTSFANEAHSGSAAKNPIRSLRRLDVIEEEGGIRLEFEADGFLYKMVRNITGTLLDVGRGKISPSTIVDILTAKDRKKSSAAASPQGLFLVTVLY